MAERTAGRLAHEALARIGQLYALERDLNETCAGAWSDITREEQYARIAQARQEHALPLLRALKAWLDEQRRTALPKSPLGQAISYALSNWAALVRYPEQGYLAIDNNLAERTLRPAAIGRKNWLFAGNDHGGRTAAVLFTMVASAKANHVDPFAWLRDVLARLPALVAAHPAMPNVTELLPNHWRQAHPTAHLPTNRPA